MMSSHDSFPREVGEEEAYEEKNVHEVYQQIAEHFSSTRYKVRFMHDLLAVYNCFLWTDVVSHGQSSSGSSKTKDQVQSG